VHGGIDVDVGNKMRGRAMEIDYTGKVMTMEQVIRDLNDFLDRFVITGGMHHGYYRQFECGDHPKFDWQLGGRLYSQGKHNYQQIPSAERRWMTIGGQPVCEVDVRASTLTIFHAMARHPLDFTTNPDLDPYALPGLDRDVVKTFITTTFGKGPSTDPMAPRGCEGIRGSRHGAAVDPSGTGRCDRCLPALGGTTTTGYAGTATVG
jgi:opacity protein-like surface antigen